MKKQKRGIFFSTDALIALLAIVLVLMLIYPVARYPQHETEIQADVLSVLSNLEISQIDNDNIQQLISDGTIENTNKSLLQVIGELSLTNKTLSSNITEEILSELNIKENIGIWFDDEIIAVKNTTPIEDSNEIQTERMIISGMRNPQEEGEEITGFSVRAYLSSSLQKKFFYFGGYVGDGNITININYSGVLEDVKIEVAINEDFRVYVNDEESGIYQSSDSDLTPVNYSLSGYKESFNEGDNTIKLSNPNGENLHVSGGYIKMTCSESGSYEQTSKHALPGIEGGINIYDSFYIPGELTSLSAYLHMDSEYPVFLNIGNTTVFNDSTSGEETITITNAELDALLDYSDLNEKTIPLRLGMENASYLTIYGQEADVYSVTDLSGSMCDCSIPGIFNICKWDQSRCENSCGGVCEGGIYEAIDANRVFINEVLNKTGNHIGLIGYESSFNGNDYHILSTNNASLNTELDSWEAEGGTCICCGINKAVDDLITYSSDEKFRSLVVMSDGEANERCSQQGTGNAAQDAIQAACDAYANYGIIVYAVGFGANVDEETLEDIADCGNGEYYYADVNDIGEIYQQIAEDIITYQEQILEVSDDVHTVLYPDSYIAFEYDSEETPYGLVSTIETNEFGNTLTEGSFTIPADSEIIDANAICYSGSKWTDNVYVQNNTEWLNVFSLSDYSDDYLELGDAYRVNIPLDYLKEGTNTIKITSGVSPSNSTGSSESDKAIYTLIQSAPGYTAVYSFADGCIWTVQFEDNSNLTFSVPQGYTGDECYYTEIQQETSSDNDAMQFAVLGLLESLDVDGDGKVDVKFTEQDMEISSSEITGIPYVWSSEIKVSRWW